ncbi:MAG: pitrilysin family protein [Bryobacterales bacterium]|nr:insulinase family protein [Bryobacteraceae bacterium]MDW8353632.1 pitrilysin family protein [Bryobacterales bacterium]
MTRASRTLDRTKPPETPPLPAFRLPSVYETELPNGLKVMLVEDHRLPLVTLRLGSPAGSKFDPAERPGLAEATAALLTEGTATRTARQLAEEVAAIGGTLDASAGPDSLVLGGSALAENLAKLLELAADVTLRASFPEEEIRIYQKKRQQELRAERAQAAYWADEKIAEAVFGSHPYGRLNPTPESLAKLDREGVSEFRDRMLAPNGSVLILLGALPSRDETLQRIRQHFGGWEPREIPPPPPPRFPAPRRALILVDRGGSVQADVRVGQLAVNRKHPDYFPLVVASTLLGGGASSRLFLNLREKRGFAYDAHTTLQPRKDAGLFAVVTQVRNEVLEPALAAVLEEMDRLGAEPAGEEELADVKNYLSGIFVLGLETQNGLANQLATVKLMELPGDYLETYTDRIQGVSADQAGAAAGQYIRPDDASIVVVGDASQILKAVEKFGKPTVIKAE